MKPPAQKIKQLRSEALELVQRNGYRQAIAKFVQLESLDPNEPDWPRRAADCHRLLGDRSAQLSALGRAAEGYVRAGMVVKAMAIGRIILSIDPSRAASLDFMNKLERPLGFQPGALLAQPSPVVAKPDLAPQSPSVAKPEPAPLREPPRPPEPAPPPGAAPPTLTQKLAAERGLIGVARAALRQAFQERRAPIVEAAQPAPPAAEPHRSAALPSPAPPFPSPPSVSLPAPTAAFASPPSAARRPSAAPPSLSPPSSGGWQVVDDEDFLEAELVPAPPSLPPLAAEVNLHELVPGSRAMQARGTPSGMFRLAIDPEPLPPEDLALKQAREVLPAVPVFSEIDPPSLARLVEQSRLIHVTQGSTVFRQDDAPESFYVIVNGSVAVVDEGASGKELYRLKENEFFGEGALLSNEPRQTTVQALEECDLLAFDREAMRTCIANSPGVVPILLRFLRSRMIEHLFQTSPLFVTFDTSDRRALTRRFEFIELTEGARLIEQGGRAPGLFIVLSGAVDVIRREGEQEHWLATLERGGVVGEMSLLKRTPAVADVCSATAGFALMLPVDEFRDVIMTHPPFLEILTVLSEERARANELQLRRGRS